MDMNWFASPHDSLDSVNIKSTMTWTNLLRRSSCQRYFVAAQRNHGVPQLQQQPARRGAPRIWVESRFFLLMMCLSCSSFCSTQRSRFWLLLSCLREPDCSPDSICLWKLLSRPAQVECQKEHWVVKLMAINHCLIFIGVKKRVSIKVCFKVAWCFKVVQV